MQFVEMIGYKRYKQMEIKWAKSKGGYIFSVDEMNTSKFMPGTLDDAFRTFTQTIEQRTEKVLAA